MGIRNQLDHLDSPDADEDDVLDYLREHAGYIVESGGVALPVEQYWQPGDLHHYRTAQAVWAKDAPPVCQLPPLSDMLKGIAGPAGAPLASFMDDMRTLWGRYCAWMQSEGRDPLHPTDTPRQSGARRARESMARTRARRSDTTDPEQRARLDHAKALHDEYLEACATRKAALVGLDAAVHDAWAAYELARDAAKNGTPA